MEAKKAKASLKHGGPVTGGSSSPAVDTSPPPPPPPLLLLLQQESKVSRGAPSKDGPPVQHADQRTTAGSERTLTRRSPSGWQAIAHPQLTARHTLHLTGASAPGFKCASFLSNNLSQ
ncbi:hypothetical protein NQZ68_027886 [Dissostichus eleginoides]|nr:hypothetical protein NQZ68_027886 [Dissostichus eleginoides]